ncbi:hypothetical protein D3C76_937570 [compost metagenome]
MVGTDGQQPGVFTLRTGIGLQRHGVVSSGLAEHDLQLVDHRLIPQRLVCRRERVQVGEFRPGHRDHLADGVELHGARAQRDHRAVQRQVLVRQAAQVTHQLGFAVVAVEHRVHQNRRLALQLLRQTRHRKVRHIIEGRHVMGLAGEQHPQLHDRVRGAGFVQ